jgi:formate-dependent nitrite reductase membrane component NrfD
MTAADRPWRGETYYGLPSLKRSPWDWKVSAYIYVAGLSGSAQIIATAADLAGGPQAQGIVRRGRYLSLLAPAIGGPLLIADLHTPQRFYNMLRIFRATSPMSIGTYVFSAFSLFGGIAAAGQFLADRSPAGPASLPGRIATAAQVPAAAAGAVMSTYTAALLSATSTPLWAAAPRLLAVRFGCSAMATAAAALSLGERGDDGAGRALDAIAATAVAGEVAAGAAMRQRLRAEGVGPPPEQIAPRPARRTGLETALTVAAAVPLACCGANLLRRRRSPALSALGAFAVLAGGMAMRHAVLEAGNVSATRPEDYFRFTQPRKETADGQDLHRRRRSA